MANDNTVKKYELTVIFHPDLDDDGVKSECEKIEAACKAHQGEVVLSDHWGRRPLSYPIKKKQYGVYVLFVITGDSSLVQDLNRQLRINDAVLRSMVVKKDKFAPDFRDQQSADSSSDDTSDGDYESNDDSDASKEASA